MKPRTALRVRAIPRSSALPKSPRPSPLRRDRHGSRLPNTTPPRPGPSSQRRLFHLQLGPVIPLEAQGSSTMPWGATSLAKAVDEESSSVYFYGGYKLTETVEPGGDLWCLALDGLEWKNLTKDIVPASEGPPMLPILKGTSMTYASINGRRSLFIVGGRIIKEEDDAESNGGPPLVSETQIIAIDLETSRYRYVVPLNGPIRPRMSCEIIILGGHMYLFGGKPIPHLDDGVLDSFCVARYLPEQDCWVWLVKDEPYGPGIPSLGRRMDIVPIYHATTIALFPGLILKDHLHDIDITGDQIVFFDTRERTFSLQSSLQGTFPMEISHYSAAARGSPPTSSDHLSEYIYIVTWQTTSEEADDEGYDSDFQLWEYKLPPEPHFRSLDLPDDALEKGDFIPEEFFIIDRRLFLLGTRASTRGPRRRELNAIVEILL